MTQKIGEHMNVCMAIEECGGLDKIEELQNHQSDQVYTKAYRIVETYFSEIVSYTLCVCRQGVYQSRILQRKPRICQN
jgi:hypothetical protein